MELTSSSRRAASPLLLKTNGLPLGLRRGRLRGNQPSVRHCMGLRLQYDAPDRLRIPRFRAEFAQRWLSGRLSRESLRQFEPKFSKRGV